MSSKVELQSLGRRLIDALELPWKEDALRKPSCSEHHRTRYTAEVPLMLFECHNYTNTARWQVYVNGRMMFWALDREEAMQRAVALYRKALRGHLRIHEL